MHPHLLGAFAAERRAQMMALSMGGTRPGKPRAYPGYEGIDQRSYRDGDLEHSIGPRPVFAVDGRLHEGVGDHDGVVEV